MEQSHVLDGNHRLVGEDFEESDLLFRERTNFGPTNLNGANGNSFAKEWRNESGARTGDLLTGFGFRVLGIEQWQDIVNVNRLSVDNRSPGRRRSSEGPPALRHWHRTIGSHMLKDIAIDPINQNIGRVAQPSGAFGHRVEHRLQFRW